MYWVDQFEGGGRGVVGSENSDQEILNSSSAKDYRMSK